MLARLGPVSLRSTQRAGRPENPGIKTGPGRAPASCTACNRRTQRRPHPVLATHCGVAGTGWHGACYE
jgi:hypothetical protein